jgi:mono/diheme cytochrome c family protein
LSPQVVPANTAQVQQGAQLFHAKGCEFCHSFAGQGGARGPDLTHVADRLSPEYITISILNGRRNMPAFAGALTPQELNALVALLESGKTR